MKLTGRGQAAWSRPCPNPSEFDSRLKCDHARRTVSTQSDAEQPCWRRDGALERAEFFRDINSGHSRFHVVRQSKVRMVECIEKLRIEAQRHRALNRKLFRQINIRVCEVRSAHCIAARIPELTIGS